MAENYYIYSHTRKDTDKCFYIGMGKGNRAYQNWPGCRNRHWHFIADKVGFDVKILVNGISKEKAIDIEKSFIQQIGLDNLTNYQPGGEGGFSKKDRLKALTPESRKKAYESTDWVNYKQISVTDRHSDYEFKNGHMSKPVEAYDRSTGITTIYRNMTEAAKGVNGLLGGVSDVICGRRKSHRNHTFKLI